MLTEIQDYHIDLTKVSFVGPVVQKPSMGRIANTTYHMSTTIGGQPRNFYGSKDELLALRKELIATAK